MDEKVYVSASFELVGESSDEAMAALKELVHETRKEPGCISYILTQDRANPARYMFLEVWADAASLQKHGNAPHIQEFRKKIEGKRTASQVVTLTRVL